MVRAYIACTRYNKLPGEGLQKCNAVISAFLFSYIFLLSLGVLWGWGKRIKWGFYFTLFPLRASIDNWKIVANNNFPRTGPR